MTRRAIRNLLVSIGVAALLAGCGFANAGVAATVGDRRIPMSDVQSATVAAQTWVGEGGSQITQTQILYLLAIAPYIQDIATRQSAGVSEDDARRALQTKVPHPSAAAVSVFRANIAINTLSQRLGEEQAAKALAEVNDRLHEDGFTVNPRFGRFDAAYGGLMPQQPNWLVGSQTGAMPSPSPSQ